MKISDKILPYSKVIIKLLKGVLYSDDERSWNDLMVYKNGVYEYFAKIGVEVVISEQDGFAYIRAYTLCENEDESECLDGANELFSKRPLGFQVSLICVILTKKLIEFDINSGGLTRLVLKRDEIKELYRVFLPERSNEVKSVDSIDTAINKLIDYGFLKKLSESGEELEVKRILKAKFGPNILNEINQKLEEYGSSEL